MTSDGGMEIAGIGRIVAHVALPPKDRGMEPFVSSEPLYRRVVLQMTLEPKLCFARRDSAAASRVSVRAAVTRHG